MGRTSDRAVQTQTRNLARSSDLLTSTMASSNAMEAKNNSQALTTMRDNFVEADEFQRTSFFAGVQSRNQALERQAAADTTANNTVRNLNAESRTRRLKQLAQFSKTIQGSAEGLVKEWKEGKMQEAYTYRMLNPDFNLAPMARESLREGETIIRGATEEAIKENNDIATIDVGQAEYDRTTNPLFKSWARYGDSVARAQQAGSLAPTYLGAYLNSEEKVLSHPETGQPVSPAELWRGTPAEMQAALAAGGERMVNDWKLTGISQAVLHEYFHPAYTKVRDRLVANQLDTNRKRAQDEAYEITLARIPAVVDSLDVNDPSSVNRAIANGTTSLRVNGGKTVGEASSEYVSSMLNYITSRGNTDPEFFATYFALLGDTQVDPNDPGKGTWLWHPRTAKLFENALKVHQGQKAQAEENRKTELKNAVTELMTAYESATIGDLDGDNSQAMREQTMARLQEMADQGSSEAQEELNKLKQTPENSSPGSFLQAEEQAKRGLFMDPDEIDMLPFTAAQKSRLKQMDPDYQAKKQIKAVESGLDSIVSQGLMDLQEANVDKYLRANPRESGDLVDTDPLRKPSDMMASSQGAFLKESLKRIVKAQLAAKIRESPNGMSEVEILAESQKIMQDVFKNPSVARQFTLVYNSEKGLIESDVPVVVGQARQVVGADGPTQEVTTVPASQLSPRQLQTGILLEREELEQFAPELEQGRVSPRVRDLARLTGLSPEEMINDQRRLRGLPPIEAQAGEATLGYNVAAGAMITDPRSSRSRRERAAEMLVRSERTYQARQRAEQAAAERLAGQGSQGAPEGTSGAAAGAIAGFKGGVSISLQRNGGIEDDDGEQTGRDIVFPNDTVVSPVDGRIIKAGVQGDSSGGFGNYVVVEYTAPDGGTYSILYGHLASLDGLKEGRRVRQGEAFAIQGETGSARGKHVTFHVNGAGNKYGDDLTGANPQAEIHRLTSMLGQGWAAPKRRGGSGGAGDQVLRSRVEAVRPLLDMIRPFEADPRAPNDGYDSVNRGNADDTRGGIPGLSSKTLGEVMRMGDGHYGAYQFKPATLRIAMKRAGLSENDKFDPQTQDLLATALLFNPGRKALNDYLEGRSNDVHAAANQLSLEWAVVANQGGVSQYHNINGNRAKITYGQATDMLRQVRSNLL